MEAMSRNLGQNLAVTPDPRTPDSSRSSGPRPDDQERFLGSCHGRSVGRIFRYLESFSVQDTTVGTQPTAIDAIVFVISELLPDDQSHIATGGDVGKRLITRLFHQGLIGLDDFAVAGHPAEVDIVVQVIAQILPDNYELAS